MASGYWQIEIDENDRHKTAFITKFGLFQHNRVPSGLTNAPGCFKRVVQLLLRGMTWKMVLAYLDDIIVVGSDFRSHLDNLRKVFQRFRENNLKLKPKKFILFQLNSENIEKVKTWPIPQNTNEAEKFLGLVNYHRDHIKTYAKIAGCLYKLTGPKAKFVWLEKHQNVFD